MLLYDCVILSNWLANMQLCTQLTRIQWHSQRGGEQRGGWAPSKTTLTFDP